MISAFGVDHGYGEISKGGKEKGLSAAFHAGRMASGFNEVNSGLKGVTPKGKKTVLGEISRKVPKDLDRKAANKKFTTRAAYHVGRNAGSYAAGTGVVAAGAGGVALGRHSRNR